MQSPNSWSCVPCAKRKVRCDRGTPCSHCKRRRGDICQYPVAIGTRSDVQQRSATDSSQITRIERLEQYIRSLGHDPNQLTQDTTALGVNNSTSNSTAQKSITPPCSKKLASRIVEQARLVEHDEQTMYLEAPVWHSWSEAKRSDVESLKSLANIQGLGYCDTLLELPCIGHLAGVSTEHPVAQTVWALWNRYLTNVHPLTKLFFDWEKAPLLRKAAENPLLLSKGENAFVSAVYFITVLSLSEEACEEVLLQNSGKSALLSEFQSRLEAALFAAGYVVTCDLLVLQSLLIYLIAMRNRARPAAWFSLMGIAVRIAQRIGLHRDGSLLGLSPVRAEEKRRVWWQMQHMEIMISQILGCLSLTLYADWDTKMPANLDDSDLHSGIESIPPGRPGLTSMSHCLWRYCLLHQQRSSGHSLLPSKDFSFVTSSKNPLAEKVTVVEHCVAMLNRNFVQYCDLLNPLHVSIQVGIRTFILAMKRIIHQPGVANVKISEIPPAERDGFLKICMECLEYYILGETTQSIAQFRWYNEIYFQWPAFVYVIIETRHRASSSMVSSLWKLIDRVCDVHPKLKAAIERPDIIAIARLIVLAWQQRQEHLQISNQEVEKPVCVTKLEGELASLGERSKPLDGDSDGGCFDISPLNFDMIDWAAWEPDGYLQALN